MTIDITVRAKDFYGNTIYFIRENGHWGAMSKSCIPEAFSNFSSNSAELYIALANCETKEGAVYSVNKYCDYLKKGSAE
jgi:hypothetical protein